MIKGEEGTEREKWKMGTGKKAKRGRDGEEGREGHKWRENNGKADR